MILHLFCKGFQIFIQFTASTQERIGRKHPTNEIIEENTIKLWDKGKYSILSAQKQR